MHLYLEFDDMQQASDIRDMIFKDKKVRDYLNL